jgi:hypothetical protein
MFGRSRNKKKMALPDIERYLDELGKELEELTVELPIRITVVGGAYIAWQVNQNRTTEDIDFIYQNVGPQSQEALLLRNAANAVYGHAYKKLEPDWLNDKVTDLIRRFHMEGDTDIPTGTYWKSYGPLEVYLPPKDYILTLKLIASREDKDLEDIHLLLQQLQVSTREQTQAILDTYFPHVDFTEISFVQQTLNSLFP